MASFLLIGLWRIINPALIGWASSRRQVIIIGSDESAATIIAAINQYSQDTYEIRGAIGTSEDVGKIITDVPVIGTGNDLLNFVMRDRISELIITSMPDLSDDIFRGVMKAYEYGVVLTPMPILYERITGRIPVQHVNNNWALVLPIAGQSIFEPYPIVQRIIDMALSLIGLVDNCSSHLTRYCYRHPAGFIRRNILPPNSGRPQRA